MLRIRILDMSKKRWCTLSKCFRLKNSRNHSQGSNLHGIQYLRIFSTSYLIFMKVSQWELELNLNVQKWSNAWKGRDFCLNLCSRDVTNFHSTNSFFFDFYFWKFEEVIVLAKWDSSRSRKKFRLFSGVLVGYQLDKCMFKQFQQ